MAALSLKRSRPLRDASRPKKSGDHGATPLFDAGAWIGRWPFSFAPAFDARTLRSHLDKHEIPRALVSPIDAVFQPEPGPANRALLNATRGRRGLVPVPVINPALGNWREELASCVLDPRVRAVRVLPNYHAFRLNGRLMATLAAELRRVESRLIVQMQLIDARHEHHALNIKPVPVADLDAFLRTTDGLPVMAAGLVRTDIMKLAPRFDDLRMDLSFAEWHDTLENLLEVAAAHQLVWASHTPFLVTAAATAKLDASTLAGAKRRAVASANLGRWLGLQPRD